MFPLLNLPRELVLRVFDNLDVPSLNTYQRVSKEWYAMCHTRFLRTVQLCDNQIDEFLNYIERNPNDKQAVETIELYPRRRISREHFERLFFQFPNLTRIYILCSEIDDLHELDHDFCSNQIVKRCQKLKDFDVHVFAHDGEPSEYYNSLYELRSVLTLFDMLDVPYVDRKLEFYDYLDRFPRLERMCRKPYGTYTAAPIQ